MKIIPAIDIRNGKCVRLIQGDYKRETIYSESPIEMAKQWESQGAQVLNIIDLDGAREGALINIDVILTIVKSASIPIQVGGGIRTLNSINRLIESGVSKVILSSMVLDDKALLNESIRRYVDKIAISIDSKNGKVMKNGWLKQTDINLLEIIGEVERMGVKTIIITDIMKDGMLSEPNYREIAIVRNIIKSELIIAGGISSIKQIQILRSMNVDGVIMGKALYEKKINLKEAITQC